MIYFPVYGNAPAQQTPQTPQTPQQAGAPPFTPNGKIPIFCVLKYHKIPVEISMANMVSLHCFTFDTNFLKVLLLRAGAKGDKISNISCSL